MRGLEKGFTLTELMISIGIVAVMSSIAIPAYNFHIARQQAAESVVMMNTAKSKNLESIVKSGTCIETGLPATVSGKYGTLTVAGTASKTAIIDNQNLLKTGCVYTYTLKSTANRSIAGKTIVADLFNNGALSKSGWTTVDTRYIPKSLITLVEGITSSLKGDTPVTTPISLVPQLDIDTSSTTDPTDPTAPPAPDPGDKDDKEPEGTIETVNPPNGKNEIIVTPSVKPDGSTCVNQFTKEGDETVILIGSVGYYKQETTYYVRDSISLYNTFVKSTGRLPNTGEKIKFITTCSVSFVSKSQSVQSLFVGNWPSSVNISLVNNGAILGRGGDAEDVDMYNRGFDYRTRPGTGSAPGDAIYNYSDVVLKVTNNAVIAGGGSAGAESISYSKGGSTRAGGGAPYGMGGHSYSEDGSRFYSNRYGVQDGDDATFEKGGAQGRYQTVYSGNGGGWGEVGSRAQNNVIVHPAGKVYTGKVLITNVGSGYTKGN